MITHSSAEFRFLGSFGRAGTSEIDETKIEYATHIYVSFCFAGREEIQYTIEIKKFPKCKIITDADGITPGCPIDNKLNKNQGNRR